MTQTILWLEAVARQQSLQGITAPSHLEVLVGTFVIFGQRQISCSPPLSRLYADLR